MAKKEKTITVGVQFPDPLSERLSLQAFIIETSKSDLLRECMDSQLPIIEELVKKAQHKLQKDWEKRLDEEGDEARKTTYTDALFNDFKGSWRWQLRAKRISVEVIDLIFERIIK